MVCFEPKVCVSHDGTTYLPGDAAVTNNALPPFHEDVEEEGRPGIIFPLAVIL